MLPWAETHASTLLNALSYVVQSKNIHCHKIRGESTCDCLTSTHLPPPSLFLTSFPTQPWQHGFYWCYLTCIWLSLSHHHSAIVECLSVIGVYIIVFSCVIMGYIYGWNIYRLAILIYPTQMLSFSLLGRVSMSILLVIFRFYTFRNSCWGWNSTDSGQ